jgi:hypothetical protein
MLFWVSHVPLATYNYHQWSLSNGENIQLFDNSWLQFHLIVKEYVPFSLWLNWTLQKEANQNAHTCTVTSHTYRTDGGNYAICPWRITMFIHFCDDQTCIVKVFSFCSSCTTKLISDEPFTITHWYLTMDWTFILLLLVGHSQEKDNHVVCTVETDIVHCVRNYDLAINARDILDLFLETSFNSLAPMKINEKC